ncbi:Fe-Mn family superoxide dismutase, partial [Halobacterium bonnevillei]
QGALWGSHPILALDVWEHSYYYDYGPDRGSFVDAFFQVVDWEEPASRYADLVETFE